MTNNSSYIFGSKASHHHLKKQQQRNGQKLLEVDDFPRQRRRSYSMDAWEHNTSNSDHRFPPSRSVISKDETELSADWIDRNSELHHSNSSCGRTVERADAYADKEGRSSSRGRGLFRAESRSRDLVSILSKGFRPKADDAAGTDEDMTLSDDPHGGSLSSNSVESSSLADGSRRFLLQKVDSIRLAAANRRDAKRTALEESLMQQLADMQTRHDDAMREMEVKLHQREAAIQTLERALCLRNEAVEEVRDELDWTRAKLHDAERTIQRHETNRLLKEARNARSASPPHGFASRRRSKDSKHTTAAAAKFQPDMMLHDVRSKREVSNDLLRTANHSSKSRTALPLPASGDDGRLNTSRSSTSSDWDIDDNTTLDMSIKDRGHHHRHKSGGRHHDLDKDRLQQLESDPRRQRRSSRRRHQVDSQQDHSEFETRVSLNSERRAMVGYKRSSQRSLSFDKHFES